MEDSFFCLNFAGTNKRDGLRQRSSSNVVLLCIQRYDGFDVHLVYFQSSFSELNVIDAYVSFILPSGRWNPLPYSYNVRRKLYYPMKGI